MTTATYHIVMQGSLGSYFLKSNRTWTAFADMADGFPTREAADAELAAAAKGGKRAQFASASVQVFH